MIKIFISLTIFSFSLFACCKCTESTSFGENLKYLEELDRSIQARIVPQTDDIEEELERIKEKYEEKLERKKKLVRLNQYEYFLNEKRNEMLRDLIRKKGNNSNLEMLKIKAKLAKIKSLLMAVNAQSNEKSSKDLLNILTR